MLTGACTFSGFNYGSAFDIGNERGDTYDYSRLDQLMACHFEYEFTYHAVCKVIIGYDAFAYRSFYSDIVGIAAYHLIRFPAHCKDSFCTDIVSNDRRLTEDNAFIAHSYDNIGGAQIYTYISICHYYSPFYSDSLICAQHIFKAGIPSGTAVICYHS